MVGQSAFARAAIGAAIGDGVGIRVWRVRSQAETPASKSPPAASTRRNARRSPSSKSGPAQIKGLALPGGISAFLGIPYAEPPVGARRWHVSMLSHLHGTVDATRFRRAVSAR